MKIYVIIASQGEYSDRSEWAVCAFSKKEDTMNEIERLDEEERLEIIEAEWKHEYHDETTYHYEKINFDRFDN